MTEYKEGDRVKIVSDGWTFKGSLATVLDPNYSGRYVRVTVDDRGSSAYTMLPSEIEPVSTTINGRVFTDDPNEEFDVEDVWETGNEIEFTVRATSNGDRWSVGCKRIYKTDAEAFLIARNDGDYGSALLTFRAVIDEPYPIIRFPGGTISREELEEYSPKVRLISTEASTPVAPFAPLPAPAPEPEPETFTLTLTRDQLDAVTALAGKCNGAGIVAGVYALARDAGGSDDTRVQYHDGDRLIYKALTVVRTNDPFAF